ncbi:conserved exported protein of unknown function [Tenacibaculum sp. 190130A14a]|uniref:Uncharacterized protein n=1 Tax=Tenacibaculum polynesiense TaxID=3137857 RepID=A0ABP1EYX3_9FLAO
MKKTLLYLTTLFIFFAAYSQNSSIEKNYSNYFENIREVPFLHLNKTTFVQGEELWFKAYILEQNSNNLSKNTTNLYCSIFKQDGTLKEQKLLRVKNGMAIGDFKIDSTFTDNSYYLKASTNYMKNFKEDQSFIQKITIANYTPSNKASSLKNNLDIQILPEGGHLVSNTINSLGIVLKNENNHGLQFIKGAIIENNEPITYFSTNQLGLAKIKFYMDSNKKYAVQFNLNNTSIVKPLQNIKQNGITLQVNTHHKDWVEFVFSTNDQTLTQLMDQKFYFLVHNTRSYLKRSLLFKKGVKKISYLINKNELNKGTNIITLFSPQNKPIAERVFLNYSKSLFANLSATTQINKDSLTLNILKKAKDSTAYFLSASILPYGTKSYSPSESIISKYLLAPYVNGNIENPNYYFIETDNKKLYNLDVLLLTQGWSRYKWYDIFNSPPKEQYSFDKGITIKGKIHSKTFKAQNLIFLTSNENALYKVHPVSNGSFEINNLYLKDKSEFNLAILNSKNRLKAPKTYISYHPNKINSTLKKLPTFNLSYHVNNNQPILSPLISEEYSLLNEVHIKGKTIMKNIPLLKGGLNGFVTKNLAQKNQTILEFIGSRGFMVNQTPINTSIIRSRGGFIRQSIIADIFLDDISIQSQNFNNLNLIADLTVNDFEEIYISKGQARVYLYSKKDSGNKKRKNSFAKYTLPFGYSVEKEYYQPKYVSTESTTFRDFGTVFWKPNIVINNKSESLKFNHLNQNKVLLVIEGITNEGKLISYKKELTFKEVL